MQQYQKCATGDQFWKYQRDTRMGMHTMWAPICTNGAIEIAL